MKNWVREIEREVGEIQNFFAEMYALEEVYISHLRWVIFMWYVIFKYVNYISVKLLKKRWIGHDFDLIVLRIFFFFTISFNIESRSRDVLFTNTSCLGLNLCRCCSGITSFIHDSALILLITVYLLKFYIMAQK